MAQQVLVLAALSCVPLMGNAQSRPVIPVPARETPEQLDDRAVPPEMIADAIVDFLPAANMPLHVPHPAERALQGQVLKLERGPALPAIRHAAHTMIRPLEAGVAVKLFLKRYPGRADYYVIAVLPVSYTYAGQP